jgi:transcription-repair coupling factor (superfamily II helicase)
LSDRYGPVPEPVEWLLRLAELRILAARWQIASVHLEKPGDLSASIRDVVLTYRNPTKAERLAKRSEGRLRVVDDSRAYFRINAREAEPVALYQGLKALLRLPGASL